MCLSHLIPAATLLVLAAGPPSALDLSKISRTLKDEPKYATAPKYCLVVLGEQARTHVWLVRDGDVMHVNESPDGVGPRKWRRASAQWQTSFALGDVRSADGKTSYKNLRLVTSAVRTRLSVQMGRGRMLAGLDRHGKLQFADSAAAAPVVHLDGPLTLDLFHEQEPLVTGEVLSVVVGTPGVGPGTFVHLPCDAFPQNAWPRAAIEYPRKGGGPPVLANVRLAEN